MPVIAKWHRGDLDGYEASAPWHDDDATIKQREALERRGYRWLPRRVTKGEAGHLLGLATPRQRAFLESRGIDGRVTFDEASRMIGELAVEEGWGEPVAKEKVELPF